jgi:cell division protein ZapB
MVNELNALASRIAQVAALCRTLRAENANLTQRLAAAEADRSRVLQRMSEARERIEALALSLPEAAEEKPERTERRAVKRE